MKRWMTGLGLGLLAILLLNPAVSAFDFSQIENRVVEHTLDNGLTFLILPRHDAPVVSLVTAVNTGCADDPMGYMGMSHMFEHMAFKGTEEIGSKEVKLEAKWAAEKERLERLIDDEKRKGDKADTQKLAGLTDEMTAAADSVSKYTGRRNETRWMAEEDRIFELILEERAKGDLADSARLAELGKQMVEATDSACAYAEINEFGEIVNREGGIGLNAGTSYDNTNYYVSYPSNKLELWMAMESDRFLNPVLRELFKEKEVVAEERRFRIESSPTGKLFLGEFLGLAFNAHPYGKCLIGEMSEIQNYNRPAMLEQFQTHYVPRNIAIGIVGDVDPKEVIELAEKYFGRIEDRPKPRPLMIDETPPFGVRKATIRENAQPMFIMGYHIPTVMHPDYVALDALATYLGSGRTSVLYKNLVKDKKTAVEASAFAGFPGGKYPSLFGIFCIPSNEHTNAENETDALAEVEKVRDDLIPQDELEKIKAKAKAGLIGGLASNTGLASQLAYYQITMGDWRYLFKNLDMVNALTTEDIRQAARQYLDPQKRFVAYIEKPEEGK
jgi:predicted Zn-dependent peptidase